jgi:hypothetical protein
VASYCWQYQLQWQMCYLTSDCKRIYNIKVQFDYQRTRNTHRYLDENITGMSQQGWYVSCGLWYFNDFLNTCIWKVWVHTIGFHWSACTKPGKWVVIYLWVRAIERCSMFLILELFWHCGIFFFHFNIYIIMLSLSFTMQI